jgi:hypothetical protein
VFVLLVTLVALLLVASGFQFFGDLHNAKWDPKSDTGLIVIVTIVSPLEVWFLRSVLRPAQSILGALRWWLIAGGCALLVGFPLLFLLASPWLNAVPTILVAISAFVLELLAASALVAWFWTRFTASPARRRLLDWRRAFLVFAISSVASAALCVGVGWSWHLGYDWWEMRQRLLQ